MAEPETDEDAGWDWACVEIFGHRRHFGRTREEERFGAKMLRVDVPVGGDERVWRTVYYAGASIFSYAPCTREAALQANRPYAPARLCAPASEDEHDGATTDDLDAAAHG